MSRPPRTDAERWIAELWNGGLRSYQGICDRLNAHSVRTPRGRRWTCGHVRDVLRMLGVVATQRNGTPHDGETHAERVARILATPLEKARLAKIRAARVARHKAAREAIGKQSPRVLRRLAAVLRVGVDNLLP
jgi:hypothetical protein